MKKHILFAILLVMPAAPLCHAQSRTAKNAEVIIRGLEQEFAGAVSAGEIGRALAYLTDDCVFLIPRRPAIEGVEAVRAFASRMKDAGVRVVVETIRVEQSGNIAFELARYTMTIPQKDGKTIEERGKLVNVWRRQPNSQWRMAVHAPSEDSSQ